MREKEKVMFGYRAGTEKEKWISDIVSALRKREINAPPEVFLCYIKGFSKEFAEETTQDLGERLEKEFDESTTKWIHIKSFADISLQQIRRYDGKANTI